MERALCIVCGQFIRFIAFIDSFGRFNDGKTIYCQLVRTTTLSFKCFSRQVAQLLHTGLLFFCVNRRKRERERESIHIIIVMNSSCVLLDHNTNTLVFNVTALMCQCSIDFHSLTLPFDCDQMSALDHYGSGVIQLSNTQLSKYTDNMKG